jgi:hypothetical protein
LPLKTPICTFDAKTGILCGKCESRLRSGQITQADVDVSKALVKLAERVGELNRVTLLRSFEEGGSYLLEFEPQDIQVLRSSPEISSRLEEALHGRVWIVGASNSERRFLEDLFYPLRVLTVNTVWVPDGSKVTKVVVPGRRTARYASDLEKLRSLVRKVKGIELMVESEREAMLRS